MWLQDWVPLQQVYLDYKGSRRSGKLWLSGLIRQLHELAWDLWISRNQALHQQKTYTTHLQIQAQIRHHYSVPRHHYPLHVHHRFTDLNKLLQSPPAQQRAWLIALDTYIANDPKSLEKEVKKRRRVLRSVGQQPLLRPVPLPPSPRQDVLTALRQYRMNPGRRRYQRLLFRPAPQPTATAASSP